MGAVRAFDSTTKNATELWKCLTNAGKCGTSLTLDTVAKSTLGVNAIRNESGHNTHCSAAMADLQCDLFLNFWATPSEVLVGDFIPLDQLPTIIYDLDLTSAIYP